MGVLRAIVGGASGAARLHTAIEITVKRHLSHRRRRLRNLHSVRRRGVGEGARRFAVPGGSVRAAARRGVCRERRRLDGSLIAIGWSPVGKSSAAVQRLSPRFYDSPSSVSSVGTIKCLWDAGCWPQSRPAALLGSLRRTRLEAKLPTLSSAARSTATLVAPRAAINDCGSNSLNDSRWPIQCRIVGVSVAHPSVRVKAHTPTTHALLGRVPSVAAAPERRLEREPQCCRNGIARPSGVAGARRAGLPWDLLMPGRALARRQLGVEKEVG
jgi:hypothetical protein